MGLDVSHDAFSGAYSAFHRFRAKVAEAAGGGYYEDRGVFEYNGDDGLREFFGHSDCDGEISPEMCKKVADELEELIPEMEKIDDGGGGHIQRDGGYTAILRRFINGCREAHKNNESLEFY